MDSAPQHAICLLCGGTSPRHAHFCGSCGNALSTQITAVLPVYTEQVQSSSASSVSSAPVLAQTSSPSAGQSVKRRPLVLPGSSEQPASQTVQVFQASASVPVVHSVPPDQPLLLKQRYQLVRQLGVGGYGVVHKALDREFGGRQVAIKEMSQAELPGKDVATATEAFKREAFMLAALTNPHLPSIHDYFTENGRWYLVMSYIEGETLEAYLNRSAGRKLPVEKVLTIGIQLASVLSYLHTRNPPIIFRDLKPSNIMRTPENQIYLIDFGIARHFKIGQPKDTVALGSPGYAAPEQYGRAQSTPQTDVYSLGATLHHMLTGIDPSGRPFNYSSLHLPNYPQLGILITCMLDMDLRKRPASMGNIKRELQRISSGRSHPPSHGISPYNQAKQHHNPSASVHRFGGKLWQSFLTSATPHEYPQNK